MDWTRRAVFQAVCSSIPHAAASVLSHRSVFSWCTMPAYSTSLPRMRGIGNFPPCRKSVTSPLDLTDVLLQMVPPCSARRQTITTSSQTARGCKIPDPKIPVIREGKELMCPFFYYLSLLQKAGVVKKKAVFCVFSQVVPMYCTASSSIACWHLPAVLWH